MELTATGREPRQRWRIQLEPGVSYLLGRSYEADLPITWDPHISRSHAYLTAASDHVELQRHSQASNPILFRGEPVDSCQLRGGQQFVLGETVFHVALLETDSSKSPHQPVEEVTFNQQQLRDTRFEDADKRIEVLTHLPEVILGARTDRELHDRLANLLLAGVHRAEAVAIVKPEGNQTIQVLHWDRRRETAGRFHASSRLVDDAVRKRQQSVLHVWEPDASSAKDYTAVAEIDWAFCTPVIDPVSGPWGLYVAGRLDHLVDAASTRRHRRSLQSDVKFAELVAEIVVAVRRLNQLEQRQSALRQFFAPPILSALGEELDTELLEPRECDVTVLFCDLRGFSQKAEEASDDLIGLLDRVSRALQVMTRHILGYGGVTGDFQGDAALGFWGWPFASDEAPVQACRAALAIRRAFAETEHQPDHPLANFEMGIGLAHGRAVAGKIGTPEQVKVTVFGPVVNLANRLEHMTKQLRVPILLDETLAEIARARLSQQEGRVRRLARVRPYGMETSLLVSELLPSATDYPELSDAHLQSYEQGVDHFLAGRWEEAYHCLHQMPASDRAQDFLSMFIAKHNRVAPPGWDGVIRLDQK